MRFMKQQPGKTVEIKSISDLWDWVKKRDADPYTKILYRGQGSSEWAISPSLCRRPDLEGKKVENMTNYELWKRTYALIRRAQELGLDSAERDENRRNLLLLSRLQHRGAATCLIDFTRNPLVALWFACEHHMTSNNQQSLKNEKQPASGKIFAIDSSKCKKVLTTKYENAMDEWKKHVTEKPDDPSHGQLLRWLPEEQNKRVIAQQSEFIFGKAALNEHDIYKECIISANKKQSILSELKEIGMSEEALFPDFDGFARANRHEAALSYVSGDQHLKAGKERYYNKEYEHALTFFRMAQQAFEEEEDEPPQELFDYIKRAELAQKEEHWMKKRENKYMDLGGDN